MHVCGLLVSTGHLFVQCILSEISGDNVSYYKSFSLQLMGSFVLAVGLWLRFDPETVSLLNGDKAPDTFFIGEYHNNEHTITVYTQCYGYFFIFCLDLWIFMLLRNHSK